MLHVALARYIDDQDNFNVYKEVIKEILQYGAKRDIKNKDGLTPAELVEMYEPRIILKAPFSHRKVFDPVDYVRNHIQIDPFNPPENQYQKLKFYLGTSHRERAICCPKHAPLEKHKRTGKTMASFFLINLVVMLTQIGFFLWLFLRI